mmetsp:Transcript_75570/g.161970  ORF Transcript_75570/g.161970 Transcript_75570/m.161970 type:complete len:318 (+) Transcript_75570:69-1022(+)
MHCQSQGCRSGASQRRPGASHFRPSSAPFHSFCACIGERCMASSPFCFACTGECCIALEPIAASGDPARRDAEVFALLMRLLMLAVVEPFEAPMSRSVVAFEVSSPSSSRVSKQVVEPPGLSPRSGDHPFAAAERPIRGALAGRRRFCSPTPAPALPMVARRCRSRIGAMSISSCALAHCGVTLRHDSSMLSKWFFCCSSRCRSSLEPLRSSSIAFVPSYVAKPRRSRVSSFFRLVASERSAASMVSSTSGIDLRMYLASASVCAVRRASVSVTKAVARVHSCVVRTITSSACLRSLSIASEWLATWHSSACTGVII